MSEKRAIDVVNERMTAHNAHDLARFLATYSEEIQVYNYPDTPIGRPGIPHIRSIFEPLFSEQAVQVEIHHQIEHGRYVVNHETVTRRGETFVYVSIYEVEEGLIRSVRFLRP